MGISYYLPGHSMRHLHAVAGAVAAGTLAPAAAFAAMPRSAKARASLATLLTKKGIAYDPAAAAWDGPDYCAEGHALTPDNVQAKAGWCIICTRTRSDGLKAKYRGIVDAAKRQPCADCGVQYPTIVMDLDHLPEFTKLAALSVMVQNPASYTEQQLREEIAKCEAVCANCHRLRSASRGNWAGAEA
jgi:hypothetical protein